MKKHKKRKDETPVIETKESNNPGSVGEFIEFLSKFPADGKFDLNGTASIDVSEIGEFENGTTAVTIYPRESVCDECASDNCSNHECNCDDCHGECTCTDESSIADTIMKDHYTGIVYDSPDMLKELREMPTEALLYAPIMIPNKGELYHECELGNDQLITLSEIRDHNRYVAEVMGELRRREVAAMLEYNTQCLAHFGIETNKTMCTIVNNAIAIEE